MRHLTEYQLVKEYKESSNKNIYNEFHRRYKYFIKTQSNLLSKKYWYDRSKEYDDYFQDLNMILLKTLDKVDLSRIRNNSSFRIFHLFRCYMQNYENGLNNIYSKIQIESINCLDIYEENAKKNNNTPIDSYRQINDNFKCYLDNYEKRNEIVINFLLNLNSIENKILSLHLRGFKQIEIAKHFNVTPPAITWRMQKIKRKFDEFIKDKI